jgi:ribosomal protein L37AE/L43A
MSSIEPQRFNFDERNCPRCFRKGALERLAVAPGIYECLDGCGARFKFIPSTSDTGATLERVLAETPYNRGARQADDLFCLGCKARGYHLCPTCSHRQSREAGR